MRSRSVDSINSLRLSLFFFLYNTPNFCHKDFCSLRAECFISAKHHDSKVQEGTDHTKRANSGSQELVRGVYSGLIFLIEGLGARQFVLPDGACVSQTFFFLLPRIDCTLQRVGGEDRTNGAFQCYSVRIQLLSPFFFFLRFRFSNLAAPRGTSIAWSPAREFISAKQAPPHALPEGFGIDVFICSFPTVFLASEPCFAPAKDQSITQKGTKGELSEGEICAGHTSATMCSLLCCETHVTLP